MSEHPYFHFFKGQGSIPTHSHREQFYYYVKSLFFDKDEYKWKVIKYKEFVYSNNLNYLICYNLLNDLWHEHVQYTLKKKGFNNFLNQIKSLNELNHSKLIKLKKINDKKALRELIDWHRKYTTLTNKAINDFITEKYVTGYKSDTLKHYYNQDLL